MIRRYRLACATLALAVVSACGEHEAELSRVGGPIPDFDAAIPEAGVDSAVDAGTDSPDAGPDSLPCDVAEVLKNKCQRCHLDPTENGAPFPLVSYSDTQADFFGNIVVDRVKSAIETDFMPATFIMLDPPVETLTADEKKVVLDWIAAGAEPVDASCE